MTSVFSEFSLQAEADEYKKFVLETGNGKISAEELFEFIEQIITVIPSARDDIIVSHVECGGITETTLVFLENKKLCFTTSRRENSCQELVDDSITLGQLFDFLVQNNIRKKIVCHEEFGQLEKSAMIEIDIEKNIMVISA